nr:hypothetical protein [Serratia microhaemolytica]
MFDRYLLEKSKKARETIAGKFQRMGAKADQITWLWGLYWVCARLF